MECPAHPRFLPHHHRRGAAGFQRCITVAGGQPYPIATCAHGTAFDKVGKASVTTDSFERAVRTTAKMALAKREKANG